MKRRNVWLAMAFVAFLVSCFVPAVSVWANQNPAPLADSDLGRYPLFSGKIETKMDLNYIVNEFQSRIKNSIELGSGGQVDAELHTALIEKAVKADVGVTETNLPTDAIIVWMGFESRSRVQVIRDRIWKGEPLPGFLIRIQDQGKEFAYFFPKKCGNLSFVGERILEPPPKATLPPPAPLPEEKVRIVEKVIVKEVPVEKIVEVPVEKVVQVPVEVPGQPQVVYVPQPQQEQQIPWWAFLPPPPQIVIGGGYGGGCNGGGGYYGRQEYYGGNDWWYGGGNCGRGSAGRRGGRGGQGVNVINNINLDNSSYSSSNATGGNARVDFNSNINNRQNMNNRQSFNNRRQQQQCPQGQTCPTNTPNSRPAERTQSDLSAISRNSTPTTNGTQMAVQRSYATNSGSPSTLSSTGNRSSGSRRTYTLGSSSGSPNMQVRQQGYPTSASLNRNSGSYGRQSFGGQDFSSLGRNSGFSGRQMYSGQGSAGFGRQNFSRGSGDFSGGRIARGYGGGGRGERR